MPYFAQQDGAQYMVDPKEEIVWTPAMPDRRSGVDRREVNGRAVTVPDVQSNSDRRADDRRRVRLTITGRAMDA